MFAPSATRAPPSMIAAQQERKRYDFPKYTMETLGADRLPRATDKRASPIGCGQRHGSMNRCAQLKPVLSPPQCNSTTLDFPRASPVPLCLPFVFPTLLLFYPTSRLTISCFDHNKMYDDMTVSVSRLDPLSPKNNFLCTLIIATLFRSPSPPVTKPPTGRSPIA